MPHSKRDFSQIEEAILTTLAYSDIFDFPLMHDELWELLISKEPVQKKAFEKAIIQIKASHPGKPKAYPGSLTDIHDRDSGQAGMTEMVLFKDGYYCLAEREQIIKDRIKHRGTVHKKIVLAKHIIPRLTWIPTVVFIGISGGLAAGSATEHDDIDLFIIVHKNTLFFSRFVILTLLQLMGRRRKRGVVSAPDKFCVNFLIDETRLSWPEEQQDVYTAREIAQMQPMFARGKMYSMFIEKNHWIEHFLPNVFSETKKPFLQKKGVKKMSFSPVVEKLLRFIQISYMKRSHTTEVITNHYLAFHPNDYRSKTLTQLRLKMQSLGLLTKF